MNKKLIIFSILCSLGFFAIGSFVYNQSWSITIFSQKNSISAQVILPIKEPATTTPVTVLAFGDMMLDREVRDQINKNGPEYPFLLIKDFLQDNDVVVANAEGPFTSNKSITLGKKNAPLEFTFDPATLPTLKNLGFTLLGQANNHTLNFGMAGFSESTTYITAAGLDWFGDPRNEDVKPYVANVRGEKIAFIGYHEFAYQGLDNVLQAIKDAKAQGYFVVIYPHWGVEYNLGFISSQQKVGHMFVDAGADVVIGAHPHVIEPIEIYKNKVIFYSLGNFIFDQAATGPTAQGLSVKIYLTKDFATYDLFPLSIVKQQASLMTPDDRQKELDNLGFKDGVIIVPR